MSQTTQNNELDEILVELLGKPLSKDLTYVPMQFRRLPAAKAKIEALITSEVRHHVGLTELDRYDHLTDKQKQSLIDYHTRAIKELKGQKNG